MIGLLEGMVERITALERRVALLEGAGADRLIAPGSGDKMATIALRVANFYEIDIVDLRGRAKRRDLAWPRQEAMWEMKEAGFSSTQIGRYFNGRDHTTVLLGIKAAKLRRGIQS